MSGQLRLVCQASFAWYVRPASPGMSGRLRLANSGWATLTE